MFGKAITPFSSYAQKALKKTMEIIVLAIKDRA